jgi:uridine kinase
VVDGILIAHAAQVRQLCDWMVFCDTPEELRFERRLARDVRERGRTPEGVRQQFLKQVKPMHDQFVEPSKMWASQVVHDPESFESALQKIAALCR